MPHEIFFFFFLRFQHSFFSLIFLKIIMHPLAVLGVDYGRGWHSDQTPRGTKQKAHDHQGCSTKKRENDLLWCTPLPSVKTKKQRNQSVRILWAQTTKSDFYLVLVYPHALPGPRKWGMGCIGKVAFAGKTGIGIVFFLSSWTPVSPYNTSLHVH